MNAEQTIRQTYEHFFGGERNLSSLERAVSTGLGLIVAAGGLRRGADIPGTIMGLAGAALVARGMSGHCPIKAAIDGGHEDRLIGPHGAERGVGQDEPSHAFRPTPNRS